MANAAQGTLFQIGDASGSPEKYATLTEVTSITGGSVTNPTIDATTLENDWRTYISSKLPDAGEVAISVNWEPDSSLHATMIGLAEGGTAGTYQICWPDWMPAETSGTFTAATNDIVTTGSAHSLATGDMCRVSNSGGALPAGLAASTTYYAGVISSTTLKLYATQAAAITTGTAVDITGTGTGTHTIHYDGIGVASVDNGTEIITTSYPHELVTGQPVRVVGTPAAGLSTGTTYYAIRLSATTLWLATTNALAIAGTAINLTDTAATFDITPGRVWRFEANLTGANDPTSAPGEQITLETSWKITGSITL